MCVVWCVCVWCVCGKTDYTAKLKVFRVKVLSVAINSAVQQQITGRRLISSMTCFYLSLRYTIPGIFLTDKLISIEWLRTDKLENFSIYVIKHFWRLEDRVTLATLQQSQMSQYIDVISFLQIWHLRNNSIVKWNK